ncbi:hypothetical protein [Microbulbifer elongatus]|uniref:hypothetical protein n=1 Tax=Microbulbifer elongatus TaxID=86173 RepID=UPI001CFE9D43|nr:hypothetical protein [Microbulbifer elongatus]
MENQELDMVLDCLGNHRRTYRYFKDKYCLDLIAEEFSVAKEDEMPLHALRQGRWAKFLHKPLLKSLLADCGSGKLRLDQLVSVYHPKQYVFNLSLGKWYRSCRCCQQTSRPGGSLVLQLNFERRHNRVYEQLLDLSFLDEYERQHFNAKVDIDGYSGHPVNRVRGYTMSWVRLDLDLDRGECLIEEVQNDWLRDAARLAKFFTVSLRKERVAALEASNPQFRGQYEEFVRYENEVLKPYRGIWAEASLAAVLEFLRKEVGSLDIYYHTADSGARLKGIKNYFPPKSLYSSLPEKFGFQLTEQVPDMLKSNRVTRRCLKAIKEPVKFYRL